MRWRVSRFGSWRQLLTFGGEIRFAAKEAAIKAHQTRKLTFHDIWIRKQNALAEGSSAAPEAVIKADGSWEKGWVVPISISHDQGYATAVCMADQTESAEPVTDGGGAPSVGKANSPETMEFNKLLSDAKQYKMEMREHLREIQALKERSTAANAESEPAESKPGAGSRMKKYFIPASLDKVQRMSEPRWRPTKSESLIRKHYVPDIQPVRANIQNTENLKSKGEAAVPLNQDVVREGGSYSHASFATIRRTIGKESQQHYKLTSDTASFPVVSHHKAGQDGTLATRIADLDIARSKIRQEMRNEMEQEAKSARYPKEETGNQEEISNTAIKDHGLEAESARSDDIFKDEIFATHDVKVARWKAKEVEGRLRRTLFVRNVDRKCTPEFLQAYFSNSGQAKCHAYIYKTESGDHLGTAAVMYEITDSARSAQMLFNKAILRGRQLEVLSFLPVDRVFAKRDMASAKNEAQWSEHDDFDRSLYKPEPLPHRQINGSGSQYIRVDKRFNIGVDSIVRRERGVYITNVAKEATKEDVEELFKNCSSEVDVTMLHSRNGDFRGVAVVVLRLKEEAKAAREEMKGKLLRGKVIDVKDGPT